MAVTEISQFITKCNDLKKGWNTRDGKIKAWYDIILQVDKLKQEKMETVVANDPRTGYNLAKHLLTSGVISHKVDSEGLKPEEITASSYVESYLEKRWKSEERRYRRIGKKSLKDAIAGLMLSTGYYSIYSMVTHDSVQIDAWNPMQTYPSFGSDGMTEVVRTYTLKPEELRVRAKRMGWDIQITGRNATVRNYWGYDNDLDVVNAIAIDQTWIKKPEKDAAVNNVIQKYGEPVLPVFYSPVGGLPDEGAITDKWQENYGEAIVATNEKMTETYNKMLSFMQHAARSAAQHRWFERQAQDGPDILTEDNIDVFGAIYRLGPNDDIGAVESPQIPIELRIALMEYGNMIQRGMFPWVLHGNLQQQLSYLAMANVASTALQVLTPYRDGFIGMMSDVNNFIYHMIEANGFRPYGYEHQTDVPDRMEIETELDIQIPGYLVQRATIARMMNPQFRLPVRWIIDHMFPEIKNAIQSQGEVREEDAFSHPKAIIVDQIIAYRAHAARLRKAGQADNAKLYEKLAKSLEAELEIPQQPQQQGGEGAVNPVEQLMNEVQPRRASEPLEGVGRV